MKRTLLALLMAAAFTPLSVLAEQGDWVVRLRAVQVNADEHSKLGRLTNDAWGSGTLNSVLNQNAELEAESNTLPELDISYYVTRHIALELILALGSRHDINIHKNSDVGQAVAGKQRLGEVNALPPTLTVQWHFMPERMVDPYIGAGINYTRFMDSSLELAGNPIRVDRNSVGPALQAGFDVNLQDGWLINADVKKVWMETDVKMNLGGAGYRKIDELDIDPWVFGIGIGKKF